MPFRPSSPTPRQTTGWARSADESEDEERDAGGRKDGLNRGGFNLIFGGKAVELDINEFGLGIFLELRECQVVTCCLSFLVYMFR